MINMLILIFSFILDGILTNFLPFMENKLSLFTPLLTLVSFIIIYPFYRKEENNYFITLFITGIVYDMFYTNLLFFNGVLFVVIGFIISKIHKYIATNTLNIIIETILIITIYELITALCLFTYNVVPITIPEIVYKVTHSLLINIIYVLIIETIVKMLPKRITNININ